MSGKRHLPYPKGWRGQVLWVLHRKTGGVVDVSQNIIQMTKLKEKLTPIQLKIWVSWNVSGHLEARVGGEHINLVTSAHIRDRVFWPGKRTMVHLVLYPVGGSVNLGWLIQMLCLYQYIWGGVSWTNEYSTCGSVRRIFGCEWTSRSWFRCGETCCHILRVEYCRWY